MKMIKINSSETRESSSTFPIPSSTAPKLNKESGILVENSSACYNHAQGQGQGQGQLGQGQGYPSVLPHNPSRPSNLSALNTDKYKYPKRVSLRSSSELALAIRSCNSNRNSNNTRHHQNGQSQPHPPGSGSTKGGNHLYREMPTMIPFFNDPRPLSFGFGSSPNSPSLSSSNSHPVQRQCNLQLQLQNRNRNGKRPPVGNKGNGRGGISPTRTVAGQFLSNSNTNSRSRFSRPTQRQRQLATNSHSPHQKILAGNLNSNYDHSSRSRSPRPGFGFRWRSPSLTRSKSSWESRSKCNIFKKQKEIQDERTRKITETGISKSEFKQQQPRRPEFEFKFTQKEREAMSPPARVVPISRSPVCTSTFPRGKFKTFKFQNKPEIESGSGPGKEGSMREEINTNAAQNKIPAVAYFSAYLHQKLQQKPKINITDDFQNFQGQNTVFNNSMFENSDSLAAQQQGPFNNNNTNRQKEVELQSTGTVAVAVAAALPLKASTKLSQSLQGFHLFGSEEAEKPFKKDTCKAKAKAEAANAISDSDRLNCTNDSNINSKNSSEMSNNDELEFCHMEKLAEALSKSKPVIAATENKKETETDENNNELKQWCVLHELQLLSKEHQNVELPLKEKNWAPISKERESGSLPLPLPLPIELLEKKAKFQYKMLQECDPITNSKINDIKLDISGGRNTEFNPDQKSRSRSRPRSRPRSSVMAKVSVPPKTCNTSIISSSLLSPESKSNLLANVKGRIRQLELLKQFSDLEVETLRADLSKAKLLIAKQSVKLEELKPNEGPPWNVPSDENNNNTSTKNEYNPNVDYFSFRTFDDEDISHLIPGQVFQAQVVPSFKLKAKTHLKQQRLKSSINHVTRLMKEKENVNALTSSNKRMNQINALKKNLQGFARLGLGRVPELTSAGQMSLSPSQSSKPSSRPTYQIRTKSAPPGKTYLNIYHRKLERERTFEIQSSNTAAHNQNSKMGSTKPRIAAKPIIKNVNFQTEQLKPWDKSSAKYNNGNMSRSPGPVVDVDIETEVKVESQFQFRSKSLPRNSKLHLFSKVEPNRPDPEAVKVALKNKRSSCTHKIPDAHAHLYGGSRNQNNASVEYLAIAVASREGLIREIAHSIKKAKRILHFRFNALLSSSDISIKDLHFLLTSHRRFIRWLHNYVNYSMALMSRFDDKCMKSAHFFVPSTISLDGRTTVKGIFIPLPEPGNTGAQSHSLIKTNSVKSEPEPEPEGHPQVVCDEPTPEMAKTVTTFTTSSTSTSSLLTDATVTVDPKIPAKDVLEFKPLISQLQIAKPRPMPIIQKTYGTQTQSPSVVSASSDPIPIPTKELDPPKSITNIGTQATLKPHSQDFSNSFASIFSSNNESSHKIKVVDATNNTDAGTLTEDKIQTSIDCCKQKNTFSEQNNLLRTNENTENFPKKKLNLKPVPEPKPVMHNDLHDYEFQEFFDCSATSSNSILETGGGTGTGPHAANIQMEIQGKFQNQTDFAGTGNHHVNPKFKISRLNSNSDFVISRTVPLLCETLIVTSEAVIPSLSARNVALSHAQIIIADGNHSNSANVDENISNCAASASSSHSMKSLSINSSFSPSPSPTSRSKPRIILHIHDLDTSTEMRENIVEEPMLPGSPPSPNNSNRRKSSCAANFLINTNHVREGNSSDDTDTLNVFGHNSKSKTNFPKETEPQDSETTKTAFELEALNKSEPDLKNSMSLPELGCISNDAIECVESDKAKIGGLNNEIEMTPDLNNNFVEVQNKVFSPHSCPSVTSPQKFQTLQFNQISTAILTHNLPEKDPEASKKCVLNFNSFEADGDAFNNNFLPKEMYPTIIDQTDTDTEAALKNLKPGSGPFSPLDFLDAKHFEDAAKFYNHKGNLDIRALDPGKYNIKIPIVPDSGCPICRRKQESLLLCKSVPRPRTPTVEEFTNFFEQTVQKYKENQGSEDSLRQYKTAAQVILDILNGKAKDKNDLKNPKFVKSSHTQRCCTYPGPGPGPGSNNSQRKIEINNPVKTKSKICANFENKVFTQEEKKNSVQKLQKHSMPIVPISSNKSNSNKSITGKESQSKVSVAKAIFLRPKSPKNSSAVQIKKVQTLPKLSALTGAGHTETDKQKNNQRPQSACLDDPRKLKQKLENCSVPVKTIELRPASASAACSSRQSRLPVPVPILGVTKLQSPPKTDVIKSRAAFLKMSDSNTSVSTPEPQSDASSSNNVEDRKAQISKPLEVAGSSKPSFITTQIAKVGAKMRQSFIPVKTVKPDTTVPTSLIATATQVSNITQEKKENHVRQIPVKRHFKLMPTSYNAIDPDKVNLKTEVQNAIITNTNTISKDSNKLLLAIKTNTKANSTVMKKSSLSKLWGSKTKSNLESSTRAKVKGNNGINVVPTSQGSSLLLGPKKFSCDLQR